MNKLIMLKKMLNSLSDKELEEMKLWINNSDEVQIIALDENAISLIAEGIDVKVDGSEW